MGKDIKIIKLIKFYLKNSGNECIYRVLLGSGDLPYRIGILGIFHYHIRLNKHKLD